MSETPKALNRPLSPHLQVYKLPMTALMSISHRMTGVILSGGMVLIALFIIAAATGPGWYDLVSTYAATPWGTGFLFAWSFCLYYHLCNGIRHLIWDTVHLLDQEKALAAGWVVLVATALLTAGTWYIAASL